jgi:SagB-type dehydrogenase family enzyme
MESMERYRKFLKAERWEEWEKRERNRKKKPPEPELQKPPPRGALTIKLIPPKGLTIGGIPLVDAIRHRKSRRKYTMQSLTLEELSFLLWATQGVRRKIEGGTKTRRTVPSGGSRHPFETYLFVNRVDGLERGLYRYLPLDHKMCFLEPDQDLADRINDACLDQIFVGKGAVVFIWTVIPYRAEWRFGSLAHKMIALDAGHLCQNLYLACEAIGAGTCAIGEYVNKKMDAIVGVDGKDEFTIYLAPVGKVKK